MAWNNILGQQQAVSLLRHAIASGRIGHAYLFHGPDGVGKRAVAIEMACVLQCDHARDTACGACLSCIKVRELRHPDVHVLLPQPNDATQEEVSERLLSLAKDPYATIDFNRRASGKPVSNKQAFYPIRRIRDDLYHILSLRPREGKYRIVVITQADAMKEPAANSFLKLLEEPGPETVLILTTSRTDLLLPTILSRCQRVRFGLLDESSVAAALQRREGLEARTAQLYARMAGGSCSAALELASSSALQTERQSALQFLKHSYMRRPENQLPLIDELVKGGRDHTKSVLVHILVWIRDLTLWRVLEEDANITNVDMEKAVASFASRLGRADLDGMARLVDECRMFVGREINLKILLVALSQAIGRAMRTPDAGNLYVPLS